MNGLRFDFKENDIVLTNNGTFATAEISSQNCALISLSLVCRLTKVDLGESLAVKLTNRRVRITSREISSAVRAVQNDGGKNVRISLNESDQLQFYAEYGND